MRPEGLAVIQDAGREKRGPSLRGQVQSRQRARNEGFSKNMNWERYEAFFLRMEADSAVLPAKLPDVSEISVGLFPVYLNFLCTLEFGCSRRCRSLDFKAFDKRSMRWLILKMGILCHLGFRNE